MEISFHDFFMHENKLLKNKSPYHLIPYLKNPSYPPTPLAYNIKLAVQENH